MKKRTLINIVFVSVCMIFCVIPFACMTFAKTATTTENKKLTDFPNIYNETFNVNYFKDLGSYFEDHFAFRNNFVNADATIQGEVFKTSSVDTVIKGDNGWLYYSDTLDDYLGRNTMSERGIYNIANNLSILQEYVESKGADFLFTVAPNKNSMYDENMPYYCSKKVNQVNNIAKLNPYYKELNLSYSDLFSLFGKQEEILYLKRDSHWNNKGALLAYDRIMDDLNRVHNDYSTVKALRTKTEIGDLNKMLYPISGEPEWNYYYQYDYTYNYVTDTKSVEDPWIETACNNGDGKLLMFRDSFGNTLLPFFAQEFEKAYFSKANPYFIEDYMDNYNPDCVVVEKVERNISEFAFAPPLMTAPEKDISQKYKNVKTSTTLSMGNIELSNSYIAMTGIVDSKYIENQTNIYIKVTHNGKTATYKAFNISDEKGDNGYLLYLSKRKLSSEKSIKAEVLVENQGEFLSVKSTDISLDKII